MNMNALQRSNLFPLNPMFSDLFENDFLSSKFANNLPAVNIKENTAEFKVEVAAPGLKKEDFKITTEDGLICISASHEDSREEKDENYTRKEYNFNSFSRTFVLPDNVKYEDIKANYEDGILKLTLPKKTETNKDSNKKQITVS
ncbi:MAG: Hsp20/alpha crystallin family protein [Ignavibacteria bacterium]|nr:Hsp20/alpha crystallin family protein [Ignavibacteria bacterium]